jgi:glycosyltransferase involved in cell wall biosynthesis
VIHPDTRVLHVYKTYFPDTGGGLEQTIRQICLGTTRLGLRNTVATVTHAASGELQREEAHVRRYRATLDVASTPMSLSMWRDFRRIAAEADVLHYHFPWPQADLMHCVLASGRPSIVTYHSDIVRQRLLKFFYRPLMRRFLASVGRIVVTSPDYLASSDDLRPYRDKCTVIPIGIDESSYPRPEPARLQQWGARLGRRFVLFIGVLRYYKGLEYLVQAMRGADYSLVIAGAGPMEASLRQLAADLGNTNIHFLGYISEEDKACLLELCRAVVFPSHLRSEAFGVTLLEGAMHSKPLISTDLGTGTSYVNHHGETGYVIKAADPAALRDAMDRLLQDEPRAGDMGAAARARYERLFTADRMADTYAQLYRDILTAR